VRTAAADSGRRLLTEALFEKVEVLGVQSVTIHPTPEADAHGWSDAFGSGPLLLNAGRAFSTDGRGERSHTDTFQLTVSIIWRTFRCPAPGAIRLSPRPRAARGMAVPCRISGRIVRRIVGTEGREGLGSDLQGPRVRDPRPRRGGRGHRLPQPRAMPGIGHVDPGRLAARGDLRGVQRLGSRAADTIPDHPPPSASIRRSSSPLSRKMPRQSSHSSRMSPPRAYVRITP